MRLRRSQRIRRALVAFALTSSAAACAADEVADPPAGALHVDFERTGTTNATLAPFDIPEGDGVQCEETRHGGVIGSSGLPTIAFGGKHNEQRVWLEVYELEAGTVPIGEIASATVFYADESADPSTNWTWNVACVGGCASPTNGSLTVDRLDDVRIDFHFDSLLMQPGGLAGQTQGAGAFEMSGRGWARRAPPEG